MFKTYAINSHSYTHLIPALGIVREPTVWLFITSKYTGIHDIGLPTFSSSSTGAGSGGDGRYGTVATMRNHWLSLKKDHKKLKVRYTPPVLGDPC